MSEILGRLRKNKKKLSSWAKQRRLTAYRLYDWDIPNFPYFVDTYGDCFLLHDKTNDRDQSRRQQMESELVEALKARRNVQTLTFSIYYKELGLPVFEPDFYCHRIPEDAPWIIFPWELEP